MINLMITLTRYSQNINADFEKDLANEYKAIASLADFKANLNPNFNKIQT